MPLLDRLLLLGLVDDSDDAQQDEHDKKLPSSTNNVEITRAQNEASGEVSMVGRPGNITKAGQAVGNARFGRSKNKKDDTDVDNDAGTEPDQDHLDDSPSPHDSPDSDTGYDGDDSTSTSDDDDDYDYNYDNSSDDDMAHVHQYRRGGVLAYLGSAEEQRQRSKCAAAAAQQQQQQQQSTTVTPSLNTQFVPTRYPTADIDAAEGFHVCGFKEGRRVYRLETAQSARLHSLVVKTAVGYCYLDTEAMLPPKVESVPAASTAAPSHAAAGNVIAVNGCFVIRPSPLGGLGAFAHRELLRGEHILVEAPLLRTTLFHMPAEVDKLPPAQRAQFDALAGHHPDPNASAVERIWTANGFMTGNMDAIFVLASRFNHACVPRNNVGYHYDRHKNVLILTTIKKIAAGTELTITYGKSPSALFERYGFRCTCGACSGYDEATAQKQQASSWSQVRVF